MSDTFHLLRMPPTDFKVQKKSAQVAEKSARKSPYLNNHKSNGKEKAGLMAPEDLKILRAFYEEQQRLGEFFYADDNDDWYWWLYSHVVLLC
jgi:hypothetical protein